MPRGERDAVRGEVKTQQSNVGAEEVLETRTGLHEVEVVVCLRPAKIQTGLVCPDATELERDEQT